jgi:hypothetical protein
MDPVDFDRVMARAKNPRLVPGIYNYCDERCPRCPFTDRCLAFLEREETPRPPAGAAAQSAVDPAVGSLERAIELVAEAARRERVDLGALTADTALQEMEAVVMQHEEDLLVASARDYGRLAWLVGRAVAPLVASRGDAASVEAVETIQWFSTRIGAKIFRAVCGQAEARHDAGDVQTDANGSAKAAVLAIRESHAAWLTLMDAGRATADGVPARAATALEELDAAMHARFPRLAEFVRPGFDDPHAAARAPAAQSSAARPRGAVPR